MIEVRAGDAASPEDPANYGASKPQRLIRLNEVKLRVGLSRASIYKRMSDGRFPKSRSLGSRCAVWVEAEIDAWIASVVAK